MSETALRGMTKDELQTFLGTLDELCDLGGDVPLGRVLDVLEAQGFITSDADEIMTARNEFWTQPGKQLTEAENAQIRERMTELYKQCGSIVYPSLPMVEGLSLCYEGHEAVSAAVNGIAVDDCLALMSDCTRANCGGTHVGE